jgi:hypothetical protein
MTLSEIVSIASIVGSAAVALSLVYVALQVRQAEKNQRGLMQQGRADRAFDGSFRVADPAIASVYDKGSYAPEDLSVAELGQFLMICRAMFLSGEDSVLQYKMGLMDAAAFSSFAAGVRGMMAAQPGMRAAWRASSHHYGADFSAFMDEIIRSAPRAPGLDRLAQWKLLARAEMSGG